MKRPTTQSEKLDRVLDILESPALFPLPPHLTPEQRPTVGPLQPGTMFACHPYITQNASMPMLVEFYALSDDKLRIRFKDCFGVCSSKVIDLTIWGVHDET